MKTSHIRFTVDLVAASSESQPIRVNELLGYSITSSWGASAGRGGTLKLQASNNAYYRIYKDKQLPGAFQDAQEILDNAAFDTNAIWEDVPGSAKTIDATADQHVWNVADVFYSSVRVVWEQTSGGAEDPDAVEAWFHGKGIVD